ncbi:MAG: hypothetical protein ABSB76_37480 [Streptosporangiaceae bacterium]
MYRYLDEGLAGAVVWSAGLAADHIGRGLIQVPGASCGDAGSIANEFQCQPGQDKGCEEDRQEPLPGASEGDDLFLGGVEGLRAARVSSIANLQGVTSRLDWYLDRVVHFDRPGPLTVDHDIVGARRTSAPIALCVNFSVAGMC